MNKTKLIIQNILFFIITVTIFLSTTISINFYTLSDSEKTLNNYSDVVISLFDGENKDYSLVEKTFDEFDDLRITILEMSDGSVIFDNDPDYNKNEERLSEFNEHVNSGMYEKFSLTLNKDMFYLVKKDDTSSIYIRVGMLKSDALVLTYNFAIYGSIIIVLLNLGYFLITYNNFKKGIHGLKVEVEKLSMLVDNKKIDKDFDIEAIKETLDKSIILINNKINEANYEKEKYEYILNNISQGFIVLDLNYNIKTINSYALKIFNKKYEEIINKNIVYLFNANELVKKLDSLNNENSQIDLEIGLSNYEFEINNISFSEEKLIALLIIDKTIEEKTNLMKKEFFANASHELKSPITSIIGYQELINQGIIKGEENLKEISLKTLSEAKRMKNIVLDMLELSELEAKENREKIKIDIKNIIEHVLNLFEYQIKNKNIEVTKEIESFEVFANEEDLVRLISNIVSNAISYNKENGKIFLKLYDGKFICKDTGIGIKKENLDRVFERFYRVDKSRSKENGGTGLGLAIVKHICINYGFKIKVNSEYQKGSEFIIDFQTENS